MKRIGYLAIGVLLIVVSCSKSNETDLEDPQTPATGCDTTNRKFAANVKPILQQQCYGCHSNANAASGRGVKLEDYGDVKSYADNGALLGSITHATGYTPMPLGRSKLSDCNINNIRAWINRGAQNN